MQFKSLFTRTVIVPACAIVLTLSSVGCNSTHNATSGSKPPEPANTNPSLADEFDEALNSAIAAGLPAVALSVRGDLGLYERVVGVQDRETGVAAAQEDRFYLGSIGKTYLAVAAVRLVDHGLLGLDDVVADWLPEVVGSRLAQADQMTLRHLLTHTSGVFDFRNDGDQWGTVAQQDPAMAWVNQDVLAYFLDEPLHFAPGSNYQYSNSNYVLAALVLERATGLSLSEIVHQYVIEPLGLQHTLHGHVAGASEEVVHGYIEDAGQLVDVYPWFSHYGLADGGIQASAADVATFVRAILETDAVLSATMREELVRPSGVGSPPSSYALGILVQTMEDSGVVVFSHAGKNAGTQTQYLHFRLPDGRSVTAALLVSASFGEFDTLNDVLLEEIFGILVSALIQE